MKFGSFALLFFGILHISSPTIAREEDQATACRQIMAEDFGNNLKDGSTFQYLPDSPASEINIDNVYAKLFVCGPEGHKFWRLKGDLFVEEESNGPLPQATKSQFPFPSELKEYVFHLNQVAEGTFATRRPGRLSSVELRWSDDSHEGTRALDFHTDGGNYRLLVAWDSDGPIIETLDGTKIITPAGLPIIIAGVGGFLHELIPLFRRPAQRHASPPFSGRRRLLLVLGYD